MRDCYYRYGGLVIAIIYAWYRWTGEHDGHDVTIVVSGKGCNKGKQILIILVLYALLCENTSFMHLTW